MFGLSIFDLALGFSGIVLGIFTIVVISKKCDPKDKMFWQGAGVVSIILGITFIIYPYILNWLLSLKGG